MSGAATRADHGGRRGALGVVRAVAVRYPLGSFVVLAFVVSWAAWVPLLADRPLRDGQATAYVCRGFVCDRPATTVEELTASLLPRA